MKPKDSGRARQLYHKLGVLEKGTPVQDHMAGVPIVSSFVICGIPSVHSLDFDELFLCGSAEATENLQSLAIDDRQQVSGQEAPTALLEGTGGGPTIPIEWG